MQYRRDQTQGGTYFFTVVMLRRWPWFNDARYVANLRQAFTDEIKRRPFKIDAIVVMPDHIHAIWTLPEGDSDYSTRWQHIKREFTKMVPDEERPAVRGSRADKKEQAIWQRRFWEHRIRDEVDFATHVQYIHYNPVKHGYVERPEDWPYSSIHRPHRTP
ncbi:MAG: transposase [Burkholderiaceae bacterium]|nr:transposase [Burkholderiaceae bacterium]